ncbi:MAG: UvrD-helicase domain-containing protein [Candidatus Nanohaloarchaea archaeon]
MGHEPNESQERLIEGTEGIYLVDAGAGTGKTFTITRRYANILSRKDVEPEDLLLVTFTSNAADEMKERIIERTDYSASQLYDAPISTFHSLCRDILMSHGVSAPKILGIDDSITESVDVMESKIREEQEFESFMDLFIEDHPEYSRFYRVSYEYTELLDLVKSLAAKGVFPVREGWFRNTEDYLDGDYDEFRERFQEANSPQETSYGKKQSDLRGRLYSLQYKCFTSDAPDSEEIRGGRGTKQVRRDFAEKAFHEDREELKKFVHDVYFEYMEYCLRRNYLNFSFLMVFAFTLLMENHELRESLEYRYVMIDEFQDTNELQFKLSLLFAGEPNICVVGDWKQSIYGFQHASVENIRRFRDRINRYRSELNRDRERVSFKVDDVEEIKLVRNYRSSQDILDVAEETLTLPATEYEDLDGEKIREEITSLEADRDLDSRIEAFSSDDEVKAVLSRIQDVVDSGEYRIEGGVPDYGDIAVLTRTRNFGLQLQKEALKYDIPVAYEGGVELFKTNPSIILLAWLRILNSDSRRGWAVVLEEAGYSIEESEHLLEEEDYPGDMEGFREQLEEQESVGAVARQVFNRYGMNDGFTDRIIEVLQETFRSSYMNLGQIIQFIEDNIEAGEIYEVDNSMTENVVTIQTIHSAKGLEYPIVFISDINETRFPSTNSSSRRIEYEDPVGLRMRKIYDDSEVPYTYDNWRSEILFKTLTGEYDEERRLFYVAATRAEQHLFFTAENGRESEFFTGLPVERTDAEPEVEEVDRSGQGKVFEPEIPGGKPVEKRSVRGIVDLEDESSERGKELHRFAERYVKEEKEPGTGEEERIASFIDGLDGEISTEKTFLLPLDGVTLEGRADIVARKEDLTRLVDLKTGEGDPEKYRPQLSAYYHAARRIYDGEVRAEIYMVDRDETFRIDPLDEDRLTE